jgi:hypothetical protein
MTTWPAASIPVFRAGYAPVQADFTSWIQDTLGFLTDGVVFRARQTTAQALSGATNYMQYQAIDEDPYSGWSAAETPGQPAYSWIAPVTGLYEITVTTGFAPSSNWAQIGVFLNTTLIVAGIAGSAGIGGLDAGIGGTVTVPMTAAGLYGGDYVQVNMHIQTAEDTVITAGSEPSVEITLISQ